MREIAALQAMAEPTPPPSIQQKEPNLKFCLQAPKGPFGHPGLEAIPPLQYLYGAGFPITELINPEPGHESRAVGVLRPHHTSSARHASVVDDLT